MMIFGFLPQNLKTKAVAAAFSIAWLRGEVGMQLPAQPGRPATMGRPRKHGGQLALAEPATWSAPQVTTSTATSRYGTAAAWGKPQKGNSASKPGENVQVKRQAQSGPMITAGDICPALPCQMS
jgi:hypothetical protein